MWLAKVGKRAVAVGIAKLMHCHPFFDVNPTLPVDRLFAGCPTSADVGPTSLSYIITALKTTSEPFKA